VYCSTGTFFSSGSSASPSPFGDRVVPREDNNNISTTTTFRLPFVFFKGEYNNSRPSSTVLFINNNRRVRAISFNNTGVYYCIISCVRTITLSIFTHVGSPLDCCLLLLFSCRAFVVYFG